MKVGHKKGERLEKGKETGQVIGASGKSWNALTNGKIKSAKEIDCLIHDIPETLPIRLVEDFSVPVSLSSDGLLSQMWLGDDQDLQIRLNDQRIISSRVAADDQRQLWMIDDEPRQRSIYEDVAPSSRRAESRH